MEIEGCDTTREELTERLPELRAQCELGEKDEEKLNELKSKVGKCKADMSSCAMQASKLESDVARLQKAILDAGGKKLKKQQAKCDKALEDLNDAGKKLNAAKVSITSSKKAGTKAKKAKETAAAEVEKCQETLAAKQEDFESMEEGALEVMKMYEEVKETEAAKRVALEGATSECETLKKTLSKAKGKEIELMGQVDALSKQMKDFERKRQHWEEEVAKLHAAEEDDDEYDASDDEAEEEPSASEKDCDVEMGDGQEESKQNEEEDVSNKRISLPTFKFESLEQYVEGEIKSDIAVLEGERATLAKNANMGAIAEYRKKEADYLAR